MFSDPQSGLQSGPLMDVATIVVRDFTNHGLTLATAESCTGGLVSAAVTAIPGASAMFDRGFVTYSNAAKSEELKVPMELIERVGAVSNEVARAMAEGVRRQTGASVGLSITGIAGPDGGAPDKPVGLVWFGLSSERTGLRAEQRIFPGDRQAIRMRAAEHALQTLAAVTLGAINLKDERVY